MGKVAAVSAQQIEVETADGKKVTAALTAETKYSRDKAAAAQTRNVKVGERVVIVVAEEKGVQKVKQVAGRGARGKAEGARALGAVPRKCSVSWEMPPLQERVKTPGNTAFRARRRFRRVYGIRCRSAAPSYSPW